MGVVAGGRCRVGGGGRKADISRVPHKVYTLTSTKVHVGIHAWQEPTE